MKKRPFNLAQILWSNLFLICLFGLVAVVIQSCKKDTFSPTTPSLSEEKSVINRNDDDLPANVPLTYALTTNDIFVVDGMLTFKTYEEVGNVVASLHALSEDKERNEAKLLELGYDKEDLNAPEEPVLDEFNARFNILSLRQKLEELEKLEDKTGIDYDDEVDKILFWDNEYGSIINTNHEVRVGNLVYKYVDDDRAVVFRANDPALLNLVRSAPNAYNLPNQYNLFKIDTRIPKDLEILESLESANRNGNCLFNISYSNVGSEYHFHSFGYFPVGGNVLWTIEDANGNVLATQQGLQTFTYTAPLGLQYPLYVTLSSNECEEPYRLLFAAGNANAGYDCALFNFSYFLGSSPQTINIVIPPYTPQTYFDFGDATATFPPTNMAPAVYAHTFDNPSDAEQLMVCGTVVTENCENTFCQNVGSVGCGSITNKKYRDEIFFVPTLSDRCKVKKQMKNPLIGKTYFFMRVKVHRLNPNASSVNNWKRLRCFNLIIAWRYEEQEDYYIRYYDPKENFTCDEIVELAMLSEFNTHKASGKRDATSKDVKMKKIDFSCLVQISLTVSAPAVGFNF